MGAGMTLPDGRRAGGALAQGLITACVTGTVTSVTMVGPLLLDISRDLVISEYLTNLDAIGVARCRFIALPLAIDGADGSPVRAIALVED